MIEWLKKLRKLVAGYDADMQRAHARIAMLEKVIRDRTNIAVDVGFKSASHVIVIGRYRNADYVQTFEMDTPALGDLIDQLKERTRYGLVKRVDAPPMVRAVFERELY